MASEWKWLVDGETAIKMYPDGSSKSCTIADPELAAYLSGGGTPEDSQTVAELANYVAQNIVDTKTEKLLIYGFVWDGVRFSLDIEHQNDYRDAVQTIQTGFKTEVLIKGVGNNFRMLDASNVLSFYTAGATTKETVLSDGWVIKYGGTMSTGETRAALASMTFEELKDFNDPRV